MLPYINAPFVYAATRLGASVDDLKLIFSFLLSYPLAGLLKRVPDARPERKNLFIITVSVFYLVGLFDLASGLRTLALSAASAYAIAYCLRTSPYMPWIAFVVLMGHLSVNQLARQFANNASTVDITGAQMVLVIKLTAFCWNVADGALLSLPDNRGAALLSPFQRDRALRDLPKLLDYIGYVLFFPSLLAGPACDFVEYRRWLDTSMFVVPESLDPAKRPPTRRKRKIPRSGRPAMCKMAAGLAWIGVFLVLGERYPAQVLLDDGAAMAGVRDGSAPSFLRRVWLMYVVGVVARTKYYGVWSLTEGACILAGLGFNGVDPTTGHIAWNRVANIDPWGVETAQNTRAYLENWNMKTNAWLRNYVYLRVTPRGKKPGFRASMATFVTSAFWHGFYPGYYLAFVLASFIQTVAKNFRRYLRPLFFHDPPALQHPLPAKTWVYDPLSFIATQLAFSFAVAPFILLTLVDSLQAWSRVFFYAIVGVAMSMAVFASPIKASLQREIERASIATAAPSMASHASRLAQAPSNADVVRDFEAVGLPPTKTFPKSGEQVIGAGLPADPVGELGGMVAELSELRDELDNFQRTSVSTAGGLSIRAKNQTASGAARAEVLQASAADATLAKKQS